MSPPFLFLKGRCMMPKDPSAAHRRGSAARTGILALASASIVVLGIVLAHEVADEARHRRSGRSAHRKAIVVRPAPPPRRTVAEPTKEVSRPSPPSPAPKKAPPLKVAPPPKPEPAPKAPPKPPEPQRQPLSLSLSRAVVHAGRLMGRATALDPRGAKTVNVSFGADGVAPRDAAALVGEQAGLVATEREGLLLFASPDAAKTAPADATAWRSLPEPADATLAERLQQKVACEFAAAPLPQVLQFLGTLLRITVVLDPAARDGTAPITVRLPDVPAERALRWVCALAGRVCVVHDGAVLVTTADKAAHLTHEDEPAQPPLAHKPAEQMAKRVCLDFVDTPVPQALSYVASLTDVPFVLAPQAIAEPPPTLTLAVRDLPLGQALRWVCRAAGLVCSWDGGRILITTPPRAAAAAAPANGA